MDHMSVWEINDIIDNISYLDRNLWESTRLNTWIAINTNSKEKVSMKDVMKFKWEEEDATQDKPNYEISNEDITRLKEMSKHIKL